MPLPSLMRASRIEPCLARILRSLTLTTSATMVTFSSTSSSDSAVSSPRLAYRRG